MLAQRMGKLRGEAQESMSLSPFLMPILFDFHGAKSFADLAELLLAGHFMIGHFTSFGKLVDEKILPRTFNTQKLDAAFRKANRPLNEACFDDIDHLVTRPKGKVALLSLKASRWTIQLASAKNLNTQFSIILKKHPKEYDQIVVGVYGGKRDTLTDKYDILRGINRGKVHDVVDLTAHVQVLAGRDFWSWLNGDERRTQEWVLDGILEGLKSAKCGEECKQLLAKFAEAFNERYAKHVKKDGEVDWQQLLTEING